MWVTTILHFNIVNIYDSQLFKKFNILYNFLANKQENNVFSYIFSEMKTSISKPK